MPRSGRGSFRRRKQAQAYRRFLQLLLLWWKLTARQQHALLPWRANHAQRQTCGQTSLLSQPQLPTPSLRPAHAPKEPSNLERWFDPWSAKTLTKEHFKTISEHKPDKVTESSLPGQMHARTHPKLLARHGHYGNKRATRRKMTVVVRPRGYTHMVKIDHFEGLFGQLWTRVFAPNKLIWKARNELNPFLQKNRCHLQTANKSNF